MLGTVFNWDGISWAHRGWFEGSGLSTSRANPPGPLSVSIYAHGDSVANHDGWGLVLWVQRYDGSMCVDDDPEGSWCLVQPSDSDLACGLEGWDYCSLRTAAGCLCVHTNASQPGRDGQCRSLTAAEEARCVIPLVFAPRTIS